MLSCGGNSTGSPAPSDSGADTSTTLDDGIPETPKNTFCGRKTGVMFCADFDAVARAEDGFSSAQTTGSGLAPTLSSAKSTSAPNSMLARIDGSSGDAYLVESSLSVPPAASSLRLTFSVEPSPAAGARGELARLHIDHGGGVISTISFFAGMVGGSPTFAADLTHTESDGGVGGRSWSGPRSGTWRTVELIVRTTGLSVRLDGAEVANAPLAIASLSGTASFSVGFRELSGTVSGGGSSALFIDDVVLDAPP